MSKKSVNITVEPPTYTTENEKLEIKGFSCPYCCGQGGWSEQVGYNEYTEHTCPVCQGSKGIKAVITIGWMPDLKDK